MSQVILRAPGDVITFAFRTSDRPRYLDLSPPFLLFSFSNRVTNEIRTRIDKRSDGKRTAAERPLRSIIYIRISDVFLREKLVF